MLTQQAKGEGESSRCNIEMCCLFSDDGVARRCEEQLGDLNTRLKHQFKHIEAFTVCSQTKGRSEMFAHGAMGRRIDPSWWSET